MELKELTKEDHDLVTSLLKNRRNDPDSDVVCGNGLEQKYLDIVATARDIVKSDITKDSCFPSEHTGIDEKKCWKCIEYTQYSRAISTLCTYKNYFKDEEKTCDDCNEHTCCHPQEVAYDCSNLGDVARTLGKILDKPEDFIRAVSYRDGKEGVDYYITSCTKMYGLFRSHGASHELAIIGCVFECIYALDQGWM